MFPFGIAKVQQKDISPNFFECFFDYICKNNRDIEMDIDLFSGIVKDLLLDNDEVTLPGLGTFVSELMPSTFSDKGYTINPPYRRLSFRQRWDESDSILSDFYSETNGIDRDKAEKIVGEFVSGNKKLFSFSGSWTPLVVVAAAALAMAVFTYFSEKKHMEWLDNFSIAGSMLIGMLAAVLIGH